MIRKNVCKVVFKSKGLCVCVCIIYNACCEADVFTQMRLK